MKPVILRSVKALGVLLSTMLVVGVLICSPLFFLIFTDSVPLPADKGQSDNGDFADDTEPYISPEASVYLSDGYLVENGDAFCIHEWQDWIMLKPCTMKSKGREMRYCNTCSGHQTREFGELHGIGEKALLDVECILQMPDYPNGCEIVSLTTVLQYMGYDVSVDEMIDGHLPRGVYGNPGDNPFIEYLGNPRDLGVGCYAPCIVDTANSYLTSVGESPRAIDVSGRDYLTYKNYINQGIPVIFWGTTYMDCDPEIFGIIEVDGEEIIWRNHSHCFVMIGYTESTYIFSDPLRGIIEYPKEDVEKSHALVYEQACIIQK